MYILISITLVSRLRAALGIRLYALVTLRRHSFYIFRRSAIVAAAISFSSFRILYSYDLYRRVGLTTAVYSIRECRADGPYIEVTSLKRASKAASPLRVACAIYSF